MPCENCHINKNSNFTPYGSFYGEKFIYDGGNRNSYNHPVSVDISGKGVYGPNGLFYNNVQTSFASPVAQAYNRSGIIKINHIEKPISTITSLVPISPILQENGQIIYGDIRNTKGSPIIYPNNNGTNMFGSTGFIPITNVPVITQGNSIQTIFSPYGSTIDDIPCRFRENP
jgi:hypothetical protein